MLRKLALTLIALTLFAPAASAIDSFRVMVYCDNMSNKPVCGVSGREDYTSSCPAPLGPCFYAEGNSAGVGASIVFPDRFDPLTLCEHPMDCFGVVASPAVLDGPCRMVVKMERPGPDTIVPVRCPSEAM